VAITLGSLFSGSGGFELAGVLNGIEPVWCSEIEPFPMRVTAQRFPGMEQLGDVRHIDGAKIKPVDIITFGSPCTDISIAGNREGLAGKQSSLFFEAIRIIKEMRDATDDRYPKFAVFENVPNAFSCHKGEDFRAVLQSFADIAGLGTTIPMPEKHKWKPAGCIVADNFSLAWRVYNSQYWSTAQRRKRIYLVADLSGCRAGQILFEPEGLSWNLTESQEAWERASRYVQGGTGRAMPGRLAVNGYVYDARGNGEGTVCPTVTGDHENRVTDYTAVVVRRNQPKLYCCGNGQLHNMAMMEIANSLDTMHDAQIVVGETNGNDYQYELRRLTPTECLRLQALPDWWCDGAKGSDTAIYKMAGNAVTVSCAADVLRRVAKSIKWTQ